MFSVVRQQFLNDFPDKKFIHKFLPSYENKCQSIKFNLTDEIISIFIYSWDFHIGIPVSHRGRKKI